MKTVITNKSNTSSNNSKKTGSVFTKHFFSFFKGIGKCCEKFIYKFRQGIEWLVVKFITLYSENSKFEYIINLLLTALCLGFAIWLISINNPFTLALGLVIIIELVLAYITDFITWCFKIKRQYEPIKKQ